MEMYASEFFTIPVNGMIQLPKEYSDFNSEIKVIILTNQKVKDLKKNKATFSAVSLKTKTFTFDRNEVNER